jgi:hypothetical protein
VENGQLKAEKNSLITEIELKKREEIADDIRRKVEFEDIKTV